MESTTLYNGEVTLEFDSERHLYLANGKKVDSVTGVLNVISKPALVPWAAKMVAEHVEAALKPGVALNEIEIKELCKAAKAAPNKKKDNAADIGTFVHEWIEDYIKGKNPSVPMHPQIKNGVDAFLEWVGANHVVFSQSEMKTYSRKYEYAGTLDFEATVNGKYMLGDIKTSSGIYDEMFFQTSAYQLARQEERPELVYEGHIIVNCKKDGKLDTRISTEYEENKIAFLCALGLMRRINQMKMG